MADRFLKPKRRVLVVDDDSDCRVRLGNLLAGWLCDVLQAASGQDALEILAHRRVDLVLLDVCMPAMDGAETLVAIKRLIPDLPVIMMCALMTPQLQRYLCERGAWGCLGKPVERESLSTVLFACPLPSGFADS